MRTTMEPLRNVAITFSITVLCLSTLLAFQTKSNPRLNVSRIEISDCYVVDGTSYSNVVVEISWTDLDKATTILLQLGNEEKSLPLTFPIVDLKEDIIDYLPLSSPQVITFEMIADGSDQTLQLGLSNNAAVVYDIPITLPKECRTVNCSDSQSIGGTVYFDDDSNGQQTNEEGLEDIEVILYSCAENDDPQTTSTSEDGKFSFSNINANSKYQLVFNISEDFGFFESSSLHNNSTVRNITGPSCDINLGLTHSQSTTVNDTDVKLFVPCYVHGAPLAGSADDTESLLEIPYSGGEAKILARSSEVGSLWGLAWEPNSETMYASAVLRRHSGLGPMGISGVYKYSEQTGINPWLDLSFDGLYDFGDIKSNEGRGLSTSSTLPDYDSLAWYRIGKIGMGDIDVSDNGKYLYVTNLASQSLFKIAIDADNNSNTAPSSGDVEIFDIPTPCGTTGVSRPWGLKYYNGRLYVGVTCDASLSQSTSDLRAYIYVFNPFTNTFEDVALDFPLTYPKGSQAVHYSAFKACGTWGPWNDDYNSWCTDDGYYSSPQPLLSDIEFDSDGSMTISLLDRSAYMLGNDDHLPEGRGFEAAISSAGDILRAHKIGDKYFLESQGKIHGNVGVAAANAQGPGSGEFYEDSYYTPGGDLIHSELAFGGLALHSGLNEVVFTAVDPIPYSPLNFSGGLRWQSTKDGSYQRGKIIYRGQVRPFLGKSAGLGDIEIAVKSKPHLELGDYIWFDQNGNGIQEPCEPPLADVAICLLDENGSKIGETSSNTEGRYTFSSKSIPTLRANAKYFITFGCDGQFSDSRLQIDNIGPLVLTENSGHHYLTNSDAIISEGLPGICVDIDGVRNDYSLDVGFTPETEVPDTIPEPFLDLGLSKTLISKPRRYGDTVTYIIDVTNEGSISAKNIIVTDYLPSGLGFDPSLNPAWTKNENGNIVSLITETLEEADVVLLQFSAIVKPSPTDPLAYLNIAEITYVEDTEGNDISDDDIDSTPDANPYNDITGGLAVLSSIDLLADLLDLDGEDDHDLELFTVNDLAITKEVVSDSGPFEIGEDVEYILTVRNEGNSTIDQVVIADYPPNGMTLSPNDYVGWLDEGQGKLVNVIQGELGPTEEISIPIVLRITEEASDNETDILINYTEIIEVLDVQGESVQDFDSDPSNLIINAISQEDDEASASIIFLALTILECDSLVYRHKVNISVGNNCQTKILPEYIFTGPVIPKQNELTSYEYLDTTNGLVVLDSIIPSSFIGRCFDVKVLVEGCGNTTFTTKFCLEDKDAPVIDCAPENDTISCLEASQRLFKGTITDCSPVDTLLVYEDIIDLPTGEFLQRIRRVWQARDAYLQLSDTCSQNIWVRRLDFVNELTMPEDTTFSCDSVGGIGFIIPPNISGHVMVEGNPLSGSTTICNMTALHEDVVIIDSPCKYVFMRNWTISEWRSGKDNITTRTQLITVVDTTAPTISGLPDTLIKYTTDNRCVADVDLPAATVMDFCNMDNVKVDMFTPDGAKKNQNGGIVTLPVDTNTIYYNISDPCHNHVRDSIVVIVIDAIGPLTLCQSELSIWIPLSGSGTVIPASKFDIATVDACGGYITREVRHMDSTSFEPNISFVCGDIGKTIMVVLQVSDSLGNANTCMISTTINGNIDSCLNNFSPITTDLPTFSSYDVGGIVFSDMGLGIPGVSMRTSDRDLSETDELGNYEFFQLGSGEQYDISAEFVTDFSLGVSTFDLVKIQRHLLGTEPLDNKYREMAADVNGDGMINVLDLVLLRKHILGYQVMDDRDSWRFVVADTDQSDKSIYNIESLQSDMDIDFVGIKVGDVTGNALDAMNASPRSTLREVITYEIIDIGGFKELSFKASRDISLSGLQALLKYDSDNLEFSSLRAAAIDMDEGHFNPSALGEIAISWHTDVDKDIKKGEVLWRILFKGNSGNEWNYGLEFSNHKYTTLSPELYENDEIYTLSLARAIDITEEISQISNDPNPWNDNTKLTFEIPSDGMVELELYDSQNRLIYERTKIFSAGKQKWEIGGKEVKQSGVYFGKMSFEGKTRVFKMIKIE